MGRRDAFGMTAASGLIAMGVGRADAKLLRCAPTVPARCTPDGRTTFRSGRADNSGGRQPADAQVVL